MKVWITSKFAPTYRGGLAAYQRLLIDALRQRTSCSLTLICEMTHRDSFPPAKEGRELSLVEFEMSWTGKIGRPLWNHLAASSRPPWILESTLQRSWQTPLTSEPNAIHYTATGWDFFGFAIADVARRNNFPFFITPAIHPGSWGDDKIDVHLYHRAKRVICFTDREKQHLERLGLPEKKLSVCPLPPTCRLDGDESCFRAKHHLQQRLCVLYIGRRDQGKDYPALLQAWPLVLQAVPDAVLILAGGAGGEYQELLSKIPTRNLCDLGIPDEIEKANAIAACDVFCLPSAHESFGIVYVDAWAYGKAVVCGTAPACREFIKDGKTGLWSNQLPEELADKLIILLERKDLRDAIGNAGKLEQVFRFNRDTFLQAHLEALGLSSWLDKERVAVN